MRISDYTFLHGSIHQLNVGEVLRPGAAPVNFKQSDKTSVSLTDQPDTALHWAREAAKKRGAEQVWVYEVEPLGAVKLWRDMPIDMGRGIAIEEARCASARIVAVRFGGGIDTLPALKSFVPDMVCVREPKLGKKILQPHPIDLVAANG